MQMRALILAIVIAASAVVACGGTSTTGSFDARVDGDGGGGAGMVACGRPPEIASCALPGQTCCAFAPGTGTDQCIDVHDGVCEGGAKMACDGPEDCAASDVCCDQSTGSICTDAASCVAGGGAIMCHGGAVSACGSGQRCCALGGGPVSSPYETCRSGICPL